jgi:hypothetical protein
LAFREAARKFDALAHGDYDDGEPRAREVNRQERTGPMARPNEPPPSLSHFKGRPAVPAKHRLLRYERKNQPLLSRRAFVRRLAANAGFSVALITVSLVVGILGYHYLEGQSWVDAFANAAMILSGMGPLGELHTTAGKIFAGCYALYSGLALILAIGVVIAPLVHRFLHRFHMESEP